MLIINLKTYDTDITKLVKTAESISKETIIVANPLDIFNISKNTKLKVWSQHADEYNYGAHTGSIIIEKLKKSGASGCIINHSENRIPFKKIKAVVEKCKKLKFPVMVCCQNLSEAKKIDLLKPNYIAYEPKSLIGGTISVSSAKPNIIKKITSVVKTPVIVGAGVHTREDVIISKKLGSKGVFVASGIIKAKNKSKIIKELTL